MSEAATAVNWGNTSPNPKGGVSSFRFLEEEKEQSTLFYLCGPPDRLSSSSVCLSFSLVSVRLSPASSPLLLRLAHRCVLFSAQVSGASVRARAKRDLLPRGAPLPPEVTPSDLSSVSARVNSRRGFASDFPLRPAKTFLPTTFGGRPMKGQNMCGNEIRRVCCRPRPSAERPPVFVLHIASDFTLLKKRILRRDYFPTGYSCLTHVYVRGYVFILD